MKTSILGALLCLLVLALSTQAAATTPGSPVVTLKIVTLNLYHDKDDWPKRRPQIVEKLKELRPDVIALQEVLQHQTLTNQAQWLADQLGYQWHFVSIDPAGSARRYGNALLTRHPILKRDHALLEPLDDSRTAGLLRIDLGGRPVNVYVTHLHWTDGGGAIRSRQIAELMRFIDKTAENVPSVVAGDFNSSADSPELAALRESWVDVYGTLHPQVDAVASSTLNLKYFAPRRIDHIFYERKAFVPLQAKILFDHPDAQGIWASDHFGVLAELGLTSIQTQNTGRGPATGNTSPE
ncbi:MAG: endonuclease/exonuclease/phosphatase family protein [Pseudoxanthomonas sp.]